MTWLSTILGAVAASALVLSASRARADAPLHSQYEGSRVGLATEIWPTSDFGLATMSVEGQLALTPNVAADFAFPNWSFGAGGGKGYAAFGGVMLGGHAVGHVDRDIALWGGFQVTIPTTWKNPGLGQAFFDVASAETRAFFDVGRILPEVVTLKFPFGAEMKFDFVYIRPSLAIPIYIPVGDDNGNTVVTMELATELEARHPTGFGGGLRFQALFVLTNEDPTGADDHAQTALEPFVGYEAPGKELGLYARLGLLVALDKQLGFGFDKDKLADIDIKLGAKF